MKTYVCKKCGFIKETELLDPDFVCPKCGSLVNNFDLYEEQIAENEIDAIIDSVIEDATEIDNSKIINSNDEEKCIKILDNNCLIEKNYDKCINCGQCRKTCENIVNIKYDLTICKEPICIGCGQCIITCPTNSINIKSKYKELKEIIDLNEKIVIAILSPGVTVSYKEKYDNQINVEKKIISGLKKLGFDFVFDESFGSDLLVLEETAELLDRLRSKTNIPLITSTCPSATKYIEIYHPELINNISTCRTQDDMQAAIIKNYFCEKKGFDPSKIITAIISPCAAKKMEQNEYESNFDYSLTIPELEYMFNEYNIKIESLEDKEFDSMMSIGSGSGLMFQTSGGHCESIIKTLYRLMTNKNITDESVAFEGLRNNNGIKEANIIISRNKIKVAVIEQMENFEQIVNSKLYKKYHFIEVMNCKTGCTGGGGQLITSLSEIDNHRLKRRADLFNINNNKEIKCSHDNEEIKVLYQEYLDRPLSNISKEKLHTSYANKSYLLGLEKSNN